LGAVLYGTTAALPIFLQTLMGYSALQSGLTLSPRGVGAFFATFLVGRLVGRVRNRILITIGFSLLAISSFWMGQINLEISLWKVIVPSVLNGIAISFIFTPLTTATVSHLRQSQIGNATGIYNLMRNLGGSIGIAFVTTMLARGAQSHQGQLVGNLAADRPAFVHELAAAQHQLAQHTDAVTATHQAYAGMYSLLDQQAHLMAFTDNFYIFGAMALCGLPLVLLFKRVTPTAKRAPMGH